jgi:CheY-like chemotaxis protein
MTIGSEAKSLLKRLWSLVPSGGSLPENVWRARHRFLVGLTFFHVVVIALAGTVMGKRWALGPWALFDDGNALHSVGEAQVVAAFGALACWRRVGRTAQATFVGFGLMSSSAILVHLSGGYIEFHFHFFVMLTFLALCQDWIPYILAVNGPEGLDKFLSGQFDLVVTDRAMPEMGGDQLATAIKQLAPDRPIIMLTGFGDLMDAKGERPPGVDVVVGKPVTFDALQGAILQVVTRD